eukprot:COSAG06_NODE_15489_length_1067_cov_1.002066_1_plen_310_part_10
MTLGRGGGASGLLALAHSDELGQPVYVLRGALLHGGGLGQQRHCQAACLSLAGARASEGQHPLDLYTFMAMICLPRVDDIRHSAWPSRGPSERSSTMASQRRVGALTDHLRPAVPVFAASSSTGRRRLGSTGFEISPVSLGCWQIGGAWGGADDSDAHHAALNRYLDLGGNFLDTADGYGGPLGTPEFGQSEQTIRQVLAERSAAGHTERVYVATKVGRGCEWPPSDLRCWTLESLTNSVDGCRERLGVETLDLVQLHCPPTMVLKDGEVFAHCRALVASGKIQNWGVSVETVEEAFLCIAQSDCAAVQV